MKIDLKQCELKKLNENDVDDILALQEDIFLTLQDDRLLRRNTREMFVHCTHDPNLTMGVYYQDKLIALAITVDERGTSEDLNHDLITCQPENGANFKLILVKEAYRGNHLQTILMSIGEQHMYRLGYTHFGTTVSPYNVHSEINIQKLGYTFDHKAVKYGGLERHVYVKALKDETDYRHLFQYVDETI